MKWILEQWNNIPVRLRIFLLSVAGVFVFLQARSVWLTGQLLDFGILEFIGIK